MAIELKVLALAGLLQVVQFFLMAIPANMALGLKITTGPRDEPIELKGMAGRLKRAMDNHFESLVLFTLAVVVVVLGDKSSALTAKSAYVYLAARVLYVPAYASGILYVRSLIWGVGFGATLLMLILALIS